jgi:hypothetical protein
MTREEQLEAAAEYAIQEANRRRRVKREKNRLAQQRCRARKKHRSSTIPSMAGSAADSFSAADVQADGNPGSMAQQPMAAPHTSAHCNKSGRVNHRLSLYSKVCV